MNVLAVGKEILGYCNKCQLALAHIIVSLKDSQRIEKAQCKTCQNIHAYKDPNYPKLKASKTKSKTKGRKKDSGRSQVPIEQLWNEAMAEQRNVVAYALTQKFTPGDVVDHPKFGKGLVERIMDQDKIEVLFRFERKTLMQARH